MNSLDVKVSWQRDDFCLHVDQQFPSQGVTALFGPSGCGKTSLLRVIAGFEPQVMAQVSFNGVDWQNDDIHMPTERRRIGLVFQEASLLPHLDVQGNLEYGWRRTASGNRRLLPHDIYQMLALESLLSQRPDQLSGGQRQRVALGRALMTSPDLLLLDEPLAALDAEAKRQILPYLAKIVRETRTPALLITHSADEVLRLSDYVSFMDGGEIEAPLPLVDALSQPASPLFSDDGAVSVLSGQFVMGHDKGWGEFSTEAFTLLVRKTPEYDVLSSSFKESVRQRLQIYARDVSIALTDPTQISIQNHLSATIETLTEISRGMTLVNLSLGDGQHLLAELTSVSVSRLALRPGLPVWALVKSAALLQ